MGLVENFPPPLGCVPFSDWLKYGVTDFILNPLPSNLNRYSQTEREAPGVRLPLDPKAGRQITHRISIHPFSIIHQVMLFSAPLASDCASHIVILESQHFKFSAFCWNEPMSGWESTTGRWPKPARWSTWHFRMPSGHKWSLKIPCPRKRERQKAISWKFYGKKQQLNMDHLVIRGLIQGANLTINHYEVIKLTATNLLTVKWSMSIYVNSLPC